MLFLECKSLAHNRAFLSLLWHLPTQRDNVLTLPKKEITNIWTSARASRRDIAKAASEIAQLKLFSLEPDGLNNNELFQREMVPFISASADLYTVQVTIEPSLLATLEQIRSFLFERYHINDLTALRSKFALNLLIACLHDLDGQERHLPNNRTPLTFDILRRCLSLSDEYDIKSAFFRNAIKTPFQDLAKLRPCISYRLLNRINTETSRKCSYGLEARRTAVA